MADHHRFVDREDCLHVLTFVSWWVRGDSQ